MAIGTSTGAYFDDAFHQASSSYIEDPASTPDNNEVSPNDVKEKKDFNQGKPIQASERLYVSPNDNRALGAGDDSATSQEVNMRMMGSPLSDSLIREYQAFRKLGKPYREQRDYGFPVQEPPPPADTLMIHPISYKDDSEASSISSTMPPQAPTEAAGALKPSGGSLPTPDPQNASTGFLGRLSIVNAVKGMMNPSTEEDKGILSGISSAIGSAVTLPGDEAAGKVQPNSPEEVERVNNLAGLMVGAPAPVASKMADGTLGSFMGVKSKTLDRGAIYKAQNMEMNGVHPDEIWEKTNSFRGADNRWRQEIPDAKAKLKDGKLGYNSNNEVSIYDPSKSRPNPSDYPQTIDGVVKWQKDLDAYNNPTVKLSDILDHPDLYKAYPWLANKPVKAMPAGSPSLGMAGEDALYINKQNPEEFRSVLLHEIQHYIQDHEGFARGGNWGQFVSAEFPPALAKLRDTAAKFNEGLKKRGLTDQEILNLHTAAKQDLAGEMRPELKEMIQNHPAAKDYEKIKTLLDTINKTNAVYADAFQQYTKLAGEVESRNVETRARMPEYLRRLNSPMSTEDIVRPDQIIQGQGIPMHDKGISHTNYPKIPKNESEELEQLMETRRTNKLMGYDVDSPDYDYYNKRIQELQKKTKKK